MTLESNCVILIVGADGQSKPRKGGHVDAATVIRAYYHIMEADMELNEIMQAISTVGFPIVACCALLWQNYKSEERHKEESWKLSEALNNNTIALTELSTKLGGTNYENE